MLNKTHIIGHRGIPSNPDVLENTYESFLLAAKSTHDGIETDIWPTKDNQLVCCHDARPFKRSFKKIYSLTYKQIKKKKLHGSFNYPRNEPGLFSKGLKTPQRVPLFEDFLNICKQFNKIALVEIKNDSQWKESNQGIWNMDRIDSIITLVNKVKFPFDKLWFISLDNELLIFMKNKYPFIQIMPIVDPKNKIVEYRDPKFFLDRNYSIDVGDYYSSSTKDWGIIINKELVDQFHAKNLMIGAWTINEEERARLLISFGVDFITTDYCCNK